MKKKNDYPVDVATFLINLQPPGFVKDLSFLNLPLQMSGDSVRLDFFGIEAIDKLRDLSTVDFKDIFDVRNRTMSLVLYDLALRLNEGLSLELEDLYKGNDGDWSVALRSDVQKGTKPEETMHFFFDETTTMLKEYLKIREKFQPKCNSLFVSNTGGPLTKDPGRKQIQKHCNKLGMLTFYGKQGSPHHLRHGFATINIEPLGLKLPLDEIVRRLRHVKYETAKKHYIHDNPLLRKLKHDYYKNGAKKKTGQEVLDGVPWSDLEQWLVNKLGEAPAVVDKIRRSHKKASEKGSSNGSENLVYITESEALNRLAHLHVSVVPLREYAQSQGALQCSDRQSLRYGDGFRYKEPFIDDLANNWISAEDLAAKLKLTTTDFYRRLRKWRSVKIGRRRYVLKSDCL